ncbi:copper resistance system multicopper oxidase [Pokkaliibacter sp. MBI-7]|uniref:copper resistance system multicopper oxidase n=1 Tax=Pokkaliibacter sp. MBI-7 TaxID=3040600 RepID=UPI00244B1DDA|nr:copper resistance system multicopper oxidase [Pokkaliibacter sp. MBI-7]MDH2434025.1 copper resistance system multicopper oxidase [Pokkaliibacter sp. MBI-7]
MASLTWMRRWGSAPGVAALAWAMLTPATGWGGTYHLVIDQRALDIAGQSQQALTINGSVPGPTLRFREGEQVTINVTNRLKEDTSLHWHGLLVPANQDGVPGFSGFKPIKPGQTFTYHFPIRQAGTYWYHSHSGFQEQDGVYGPLIIEPAGKDPVQADRDYVVMLSDWGQDKGATIYRNLKRKSDYYNNRPVTVGDFLDQARQQGFSRALDNRLAWGQMRMMDSDISDVSSGYTYLINGKSAAENWTALFKPGERVRLRFINGSAMSYFDVRIPGLKMTVVQADGNNVQPVSVDEFRMAVAETYDVIVEPQDNRAYTLFAQTVSRSSYARATLAPQQGMTAAVPPLSPVPVLTMADMGMAPGGMDHSGMDHSQMAPATMPMNGDMAGMDHSKMDHSQMAPATMPMSGDMTWMDHSKMDHSQMAPATMPMSGDMAGMDHSKMDHSQMAPATMPMNGDMAGMDHSKMDHSQMAPATMPMSGDMAGMDHSKMDHSQMDHGQMPSPPAAVTAHRSDYAPGSGLEPKAADGGVFLVYGDLTALQPYKDYRKPDREIELRLTGNMERYIWSINGVKYSDAEPMHLTLGERVRIRFVNDTMMMHPMHLHGMWMQLDQGKGAFNPLKHIVNVAPGTTMTVDIPVDAVGEWAFHCHLMYHMAAGMFRKIVVDRPASASADGSSSPGAETVAVNAGGEQHAH